MKQMYEEFGRSRKGYSYEDIVRISSGIAGKDLSPFFERYVAGSEMLDIAPTFAAMGLRFDTMIDEFYLTEAARTSTLQEQIRHSMLGF